MFNNILRVEDSISENIKKHFQHFTRYIQNQKKTNQIKENNNYTDIQNKNTLKVKLIKVSFLKNK